MKSFSQSAVSGPGSGLWIAVPILLSVILVAGSQAAYLHELPTRLEQPDGRVIDCYVSGDEFFHRVHDASGYTIVKDPTTGYLVYGQRDGDRLVASTHIVGEIDPAALGLTPGLGISEAEYSRRVAFRRAGRIAADGQTHWMPNTGLLNNIVIYIRFSDESEFAEEISLYDDWFNDTAEGANSMTRYFTEVSYEQLEVSTTLYPPAQAGMVVSYQNDHPRSYYQPHSVTNPGGYSGDVQAAQREFALLQAAVEAVGGEVPAELDLDYNEDGYVDNVCFIVRGDADGWSDLLWPHMWQLYEPAYAAYIYDKQVWTFNFQLQNTLSAPTVGVGVLCHEMFHSLGSPDLYHYNESSQDLQPVGKWDLMEWNTNPPQHMGAYMKYKYGGWLPAPAEISGDGNYALQPLTSQTGCWYKIPSPNSQTEYFVVEYRKISSSMFEANLPGSGMLVYRINPAVDGNADGPPDEVYIYRPGGTQNQDGTIDSANFSTDVGRTEINDSTNPSSFLSNGADGGLDIRNIGVSASTISFQLGEGGSPGSCATAMGDANGDVTVNILDIIAIVNHILDSHPLDEGGQACADVNEDGSIDILDLTATVNVILAGKRPADSADIDLSERPVVWSVEQIDSTTRLGLQGNRIGGIELRCALPSGRSLSGPPRVGGARPEVEILWVENEGQCVILVYTLTGEPIADQELEIDIALTGTAGPTTPQLVVTPDNFILASPEGHRLAIARDPIWDRGAGALDRGSRIDLHPSPTRGPIDIDLVLPTGGEVRVAVHDCTGRLVRVVYEGFLPAGRSQVGWDGETRAGEAVPAGIYFLRLTREGSVLSRRLLVLH